MVATTHHIAARRTTPLSGLRARWAAFTLKHSRRVQTVFFERLRTTLPVLDPDRHALDAPSLEDAFAHLASDHPDTVTPADGGQPARNADHETLLLAVCDEWFRGAHGPERSWSPQTLARYGRLLSSVSTACRNWPGGGAS